MIVRGTTPTMTFTLPMEASVLSEGYIIISQNNITVIEKLLEDCVLEGREISAKFSQQETLRLTGGVNVEIGLVLKTYDGERLESTPIKEYVGDTRKNEVI